MNKRRTTKKPRKNTKTNKSKINLINKILILVLISLVATLLSYFVLLKDHNENIEKTITQKVENKIEEKKEDKTFFVDDNGKNKIKEITKVDKFEEYNKDLEKDYEEHIEPVKKIEEEKSSTKVEEIKTKIKEAIEKVIKKKDDEEKVELKEESNKEEVVKEIDKAVTPSKPMLAIVIDDVTLQSQVNSIKDIGYVINMAFMPPTSNHKDSAKIAQNIEHAIVHFPLQASITRFEEENTLKVGDSYSKIEKRVKKVREQYPNVKYTNNHTGSVFTADDKSMDLFIKALKKYDFQFIDSRTTATSVAKKYTKKHNMHYIARNIFLDNNKDYKYIQTQLKKAIEIAKKKGSAIAIGHPYPITMKVLKESKDLVADVNMVYIHQLPLN